MNSQSNWLNVDFREIPQGNVSNGDQDAFELFARDLFEALGFKIIKGPARGADDRKDLIVSEVREGKFGGTEVKFLVSCKHFAHTKQENKSVGNSQEPDVIGRLRNNGCKGFIGFYSTIASEGLLRELNDSKKNNLNDIEELHILDKAKIVDFLHANEKTLELYKRYFPISFKSNRTHELESCIYAHRPRISCKLCKKDILEDMSGKIISLVENEPKIMYGEPDWDYPIEKVKEIIFSCDFCFDQVINLVDKRYLNWPFQVQETNVARYTDPKFFIDNLMREVNFIRAYSNRYTDSSYRVWNNLNRAMFYFVSRTVDKPSINSMSSIFTKYEL